MILGSGFNLHVYSVVFCVVSTLSVVSHSYSSSFFLSLSVSDWTPSTSTRPSSASSPISSPFHQTSSQSHASLCSLTWPSTTWPSHRWTIRWSRRARAVSPATSRASSASAAKSSLLSASNLRGGGSQRSAWTCSLNPFPLCPSYYSEISYTCSFLHNLRGHRCAQHSFYFILLKSPKCKSVKHTMSVIV